jgi:hypothetical protein
VCEGDRIGGAFAHVEVTVPGGSWNLFPGTTATMGANGNLTNVGKDFDGTFTSTKAGGKRHATDATASTAPLPSAELETATGSLGLYADATGVEVGTITIRGDRGLLHVVAGKGYVTLSGHPPLQVVAGYSAQWSNTGVNLTTSWPASAAKLLPASMRPPSVSRLRYRTAPSPAVVFRLDRAARVQLRVMRGSHVVDSMRMKGRRGANAIAVPPLGKGHYQLLLRAVGGKGATTVVTRAVIAR